MKKLGVFIGRFQPLHAGHVSIVAEMVTKCDLVLVLIGSANVEPSLRNPYTFAERREHFRRMFGSRVLVAPLNDHPYDDDAWQKEVRATIGIYLGEDACNVTLFGHAKDGNDYLYWFPEYHYQEMENSHHVSGTEIREQLLLERNLPESVLEEYAYTESEKAMFKDYPYADSLHFVTADTVLTCNGKILLIRRKNSPGRGSWALPGGFKNANESALACAKRELEEETGVRNARFRGSETFHCPSRHMQNNGIPRVTIAFWATLEEYIAPIAADDAEDCAWLEVQSAIDTLRLFSDHRAIICKMLDVKLTPAHVTGAVYHS
jgi:bifunctional NMN adenylyltransferase/nudix hydrolase